MKISKKDVQLSDFFERAAKEINTPKKMKEYVKGIKSIKKFVIKTQTPLLGCLAKEFFLDFIVKSLVK